MPCDPAEAETNFRWYFEVTILYQISFCLFPYIVNVVVKPTQRQIGVEKVRGVPAPQSTSASAIQQAFPAVSTSFLFASLGRRGLGDGDRAAPA